jgi:hypothetical protein
MIFILAKLKVMRIDLQANEYVLKASDGKHYRDESKIEGKLILTNRKLYFATNGVGVKIKLAVDPAEITEVMPFNNRVIFSNGLTLMLKNGEELKFEVRKRNDWAGMITKFM